MEVSFKDNDKNEYRCTIDTVMNFNKGDHYVVVLRNSNIEFRLKCKNKEVYRMIIQLDENDFFISLTRLPDVISIDLYIDGNFISNWVKEEKEGTFLDNVKVPEGFEILKDKTYRGLLQYLVDNRYSINEFAVCYITDEGGGEYDYSVDVGIVDSTYDVNEMTVDNIDVSWLRDWYLNDTTQIPIGVISLDKKEREFMEINQPYKGDV